MDVGSALLKFFHTFVALTGMSINIFLIYLAVFISPKSIRTYATIIINFAVTDLSACFLDLFTQARMIIPPFKMMCFYVFHGLCQFTGPFSCKFGVSALLHIIPHTAWSLLLSFSYRYYILHHPGLTRKSLVIIITIIYIPSFIQMMAYWPNIENGEVLKPYADIYFPHYNLGNTTDGVFVGIVDFFTPSSFYTVFNVSVPIFPVYVAIFVLQRKIVAHLMAHAGVLSSETKAVHSQMLKCMTFQAMIPIFLLSSVILYFISQFGILNNPIIEHAIFAMFLPMPVLSPLTYIFFVRPYRVYCKRIWSAGPNVSGRGSSGRFDSTNCSVSPTSAGRSQKHTNTNTSKAF